MAEQKILPFYGHGKGRDYCEFSNFYWHDVPYTFVMPEYALQSWTPKEIQCQFSEKAIMALKASLFDDQETFGLIVESMYPDEAKALGRQVQNFQEDLWSKHLEETAFEVVYQKFNSSKRLRELLLKTGNKLIVEAAPTDHIWGVGLAKSDPRIWDPTQWDGKNVLGRALMQAREKLREAPASQAVPKPEAKRARKSQNGDAEQQILPFYSHRPNLPFCEFSNFYWHDMPYTFVMPEYARQRWTPKEIQCQFSEKAIMAIKASLFDDQETFRLIDKSTSPDDTKALGRKVKNFNTDLWSKHLEQTAFEVVYQKFNSFKHLRELLLKTENKLLVEAAPNDRIWGVGLAKSDPKIWNPKQWNGTNVLGNALMQAREKLRDLPAQPQAEPEAGTEPKRARWRRGDAAEPSQAATEVAPTSLPASAFDCYVVLDFEATCDACDKMQMNPQEKEIIEFPLVLVDAKSLKQVDEFRTYVRPTCHPVLTDFCKELTGIQQEQVADAPLWPDARAMAEAWLEDRMQTLGYKRYVFATCGDWDLKTMLPSQCVTSKEEVPMAFRRWLNVKKLYEQFSGKRKDMLGMLEGLALKHEGHHHSGLDDCRNIARILIALVQRGSVIKEDMLSVRQGGYGQ
ncbi:unnamed protein product [Cladocopium goreaui]|uniref:NADAR domain-containing protein n=1 Tax=Cladocopium goreaui TaxID=2562237 RepID=A0A9P1GHC4_9DINO|nr:unnamed protein product [Cladocopium goreaui]